MQDAVPLSRAKQRLLAQYTRGERPRTTAREGSIPRRGASDTTPLSSAQHGLWFLHQLVPGTAAYNIPCTIRVRSALDSWLLQESINAIVRRHEALRTAFMVVDGQPRQIITPSVTVRLPVVDLQGTLPSRREGEARRLASMEAARPFNLAEAPLLRATLLCLAPEDHLLLLTMHHIVSDEWSVGVFLRELTTLYAAYSSGEPAPLPVPPIQFADVVLWQQQRLHEPAQDAHVTYWRDKLAGAAEVLELRTDQSRPPHATFAGAQYSLVLPSSLSSELSDLSKVERATKFMTLVASFQVLLQRYTGQEDLLVGSPFAGRTVPETEQLIGFFVNTLVLHGDLTNDPTFQEYLRRVRDDVIGAYMHQDVPFERIVQALDPVREPNRHPLFQVMLALEPPQPPLPVGWSIQDAHVANGTSKFDLTLEIEDRPDGLNCRFEYSTQLFEPATIARLAGHWRQLLESIVIDPTRRLSQLQLLSADERYQMLNKWNTTDAAYPTDKCIHQLFEAQVERDPDVVAVVCNDECLTYRELNRRANRLAHHLHTLGIGPDVLVGLAVDRSLDLMVGLLGILKAGGAYVPVDPTYPDERIGFMLEDAQVPVLVTQQHLIAAMPAKNATVVCLDSEVALDRQRETNPACMATPESLAYVIYTSGSTGRPKGVQVVHRGVVNFLASMRTQPGLSAGDTLLAVTTLSFDIAALELFLPLIVGARVVLVSRETAASGPELAHLLKDRQVTVMQATPATWRLLLATGWEGDRRLKVLCGGEPLTQELAEQLLPRVGSLWNLYGPTETTIWSTLCQIEPDRAITIGRPIANTQVYVLDSNLQPLPIGVPGELHIGGAGLARGYRNRPELTGDRFISNPFSPESGARLYKTGDLARFLADGTIACLGRIDNQVKVRGFRIEPGEIEDVLAQHPAVRECAVVARDDVAGEKQLVAYIVAAEQAPSNGQLREHLKQRLPDYMTPAVFVLLDSLPLTPNGKVDRRALPELSTSELLPGGQYVAPALPIHEQLVHLWEELLDVRPIGIRDNFFDLGGHSLLAANLITRIEDAFAQTIQPATFVADATIEHLANMLMWHEEPDTRSSLLTLQQDGAKRPFFFLHGDYLRDPVWCVNLARYLGHDQPLYALEPLRLEGWQHPPTLSAMAATHVEIVRRIQPEGPYLLGGWCNGALVAFEMAQQLRAAGEQVSVLLLMEPYASELYQRITHSLMRHLARLVGWPLEDEVVAYVKWSQRYKAAYRLVQYGYRVMRYGHRRAFEAYRALRDTVTAERASDLVNSQPSIHTRRRRRWETLPRADWLEVFEWIAMEYEAHAYADEVIVIRSSEARRHQPVTGARWYTGNKHLAVRAVPGTHITCRTDHVRALADAVSGCLDTVAARSSAVQCTLVPLHGGDSLRSREVEHS